MSWITIQSRWGTLALAVSQHDITRWHAVMTDMRRAVRRLDRMGYTSDMDYTNTILWVEQTFEHQLLLMEIAFSDYVVEAAGACDAVISPTTPDVQTVARALR